jgi:hypothetical protein
MLTCLVLTKLDKWSAILLMSNAFNRIVVGTLGVYTYVQETADNYQYTRQQKTIRNQNSI